MQFLAPLVLTLSALAYASPDAQPEPNTLEIRYAYLRPHNVPRENSLSGLLRRQTCSQLGLAACVDPVGFCCPVTSVCCTGVGAGGCCDDTEFCSSVDGIPGCCPLGTVCTLPPTGTGPNPLPSVTPSVVPSVVPSVIPPVTGTASGGVVPTVTSLAKSTITGITGSSSAAGGAIPTGTVSLLPPSINPSLLPSHASSAGGLSSSSGASPSTSGGNGTPFSSGASPSTATSLGFMTLCGSALVSLLAAALICECSLSYRCVVFSPS